MITFKSKVDASFYAILGVYLVISIAMPLAVKSMESGVAVVVIFLLVFWLIHSIRYTINDQTGYLTVSAPIYGKHIAIASIKSIKKSNSAIAAPAASFDRIIIETTNVSVTISPRDQARFISLLKEINPGIEVEDKLLI